MSDEQDYLSYLLRMWRITSNGNIVWRASVESPHTGERHGFADLQTLFAFLEERTDGRTQLEVQARNPTSPAGVQTSRESENT